MTSKQKITHPSSFEDSLLSSDLSYRCYCCGQVVSSDLARQRLEERLKGKDGWKLTLNPRPGILAESRNLLDPEEDLQT